MKRAQIILIPLVILSFLISPFYVAYATVPTWDVGLNGPPPQMSTGGTSMRIPETTPGWFTDKERQISFDFSSISSLSDLGSSLTGAAGAVGNQILPSWDGIAYYIARLVVVQIKTNLINWARDGFNGQPNFIENPEMFFRDVADQASAVFIEELGQQIAGNPDFLCQNFSFYLQLSLPGAPGGYLPRARCTLDEAMQNVERFTDDFAVGGWNNFIRINQQNNNYYGSYILSLEGRQNAVAQEVFNRTQAATWGNGYLGPENCPPGMRTGAGCEGFVIQSPGKLVGDRIGQVVGSDLESVISADEISEVVQIMLDMAVNSLIRNFTTGNNRNSGGFGF